MSTRFLLSLVAVVALVMCARWVLGWLPLSHLAKQLSVGDAVLSGVGLLGLALHCGSMFFTGWVRAIPGASGPTEAINALAAASIVWYTVPALLLVAGLRKLHWSGVVAVSLALLAVGLTMYGGAPLTVHLATIFAAVVALALVAAALALPSPRRRAASPA